MQFCGGEGSCFNTSGVALENERGVTRGSALSARLGLERVNDFYLCVGVVLGFLLGAFDY